MSVQSVTTIREEDSSCWNCEGDSICTIFDILTQLVSLPNQSLVLSCNGLN